MCPWAVKADSMVWLKASTVYPTIQDQNVRTEVTEAGIRRSYDVRVFQHALQSPRFVQAQTMSRLAVLSFVLDQISAFLSCFVVGS